VGAFGNTINQSFDKVPSLKKLADKLAQSKTNANHTPTANFKADNPTEMEAGMEVEHQKFGFGKIIAIEGGLANRIATIDFGEGTGVKKIVLNYAKLMIVR
jgi:DNA helicase-2/ATP-dependent DNA helicase PcrA